TGRAARRRRATRRAGQAAMSSAEEVSRAIGRKAVPGTTDGTDEFIVSVRAVRLTQAADVNVDRPHLHVDVAAPDSAAEPGTAEDAIRVLHEELEQSKLRGRERHFFGIRGDAT